MNDPPKEYQPSDLTLHFIRVAPRLLLRITYEFWLRLEWCLPECIDKCTRNLDIRSILKAQDVQRSRVGVLLGLSLDRWLPLRVYKDTRNFLHCTIQEAPRISRPIVGC